MKHLLACGAALAFALAGCNGSSSGGGGGGGGGGPPPPPPANLAPFFAGLEAILSVGGASIQLCWEAANDDSSAPSAIRYNIYRAASRGAHTFASPSLTTAPGVTCVTLNGTIGVREFFVVRAVDASGVEDDNMVELSVTPLASSQLIFVDDSAAGPGTGAFSDPYTSIESGIMDAESLPGGGIVLVAAGTYNEQARLTVNGTTNPIGIVGGFPNWATFGGAQPSASALLAAFAPKTNLTTVSGTGITHFTTSTEGLVHVENNGRPTFITGLRISDAEHTAVLGIDVDLEVSCCHVRDPAGDNVTSFGMRFETSDATFDNRFAVIGCDIREIDTTGVRFGGTTAWAVISNNFIGLEQASSDSLTGIDNNTSLFAITDTSSVVVPSGVTLRIKIERNEIFRTNDGGIELDFTPESDGVAGSVDVQSLWNRIEFIDSDDGILIDDLFYFGDGGTGTFTIHGNRVTSVSSTGFDIDWQDTQILGTAADIDGPTTLTITKNWVVMPDDGVCDFDNIMPPPGGAATIHFDDNQASNIESTAFEMDSTSPPGAGPVDGRIVFNMRRNKAVTPNNGDYPDLDLDNPPGPNGGITLLFEDNRVETPDSSDAIFDIAIDDDMGSNAAGTVFNQTAHFFRNILIESVDADSDGHIYVRCHSSNGATDRRAEENFILATSAGVEIEHDDSGDASGPAGSCSIVVTKNEIWSGGEEGVDLEADPASGGLTYIEVSHNDLTCEDEAVLLELFSGNVDGGRVHSVVYNNLVRGNDDNWLCYDDSTSSDSDEIATAYIGNNTFQIGTESSGAIVRVAPNGVVLFRSNFVGFGEVDSDDGLEIDADSTNPGLVYVLNNTMAYNPGDAVNVDNTNPQMINNTIAFNGMGGTTSDYGVHNQPASNGQPFILNSIIYRNGGGDLEDTFAFRSLVGDQNPPVGFGNVTGDPIFDFGMDLFDFDRNFRLRQGSPAIDAGDPNTDFNDPDGTRNNMGAYGGPGAGRIGSWLPDECPEIPMVVLGLARPASATLPAQVHLHGGAPLQAFGPANPLVIFFSRSVDATTLASGITVRANGTPVAGTFATIHSGRGATFTPGSAVAAGSVIRVSAGSALRAASGGPALLYPYWAHFGVLPASTSETEPPAGPDANGSAGTAQAIAGTPATLNLGGTLFTEVDVDMYSFSATAGERIQTTVVAERRSTPVTGDFVLELIDSDGTTVLVSNDQNCGPLSGGRLDPFIDFIFPATGTYYLRVTAKVIGGPYAYDLQWLVR